MLTVDAAYKLLWQLSGTFERRVPGWTHSLLVWRGFKRDRRVGSRLAASLCVRQTARGLASRSVVSIQHPGAPSNKLIAALVKDIEGKLRERGYKLDLAPLPEQPLLAFRNLPARDLRAEHLFLSELTDTVVSPLPRRISTTVAFSRALAAGGGWSLHESEWTTSRAIHVCGREATAHVRVRIAPPTSINSEISVQVWLPWSGRGRRPQWLDAAMRLLARQLRTGSLRVRRIPSQPALMFAWRAPPRSAEAIMRLASEISALPLGGLPRAATSA
jgi:hypothetical protein